MVVEPAYLLGAAPGKLILFGEHAVLYGQPAAGMALSRGVKVQLRRGTGKVVARLVGGAGLVTPGAGAASPDAIVKAALGGEAAAFDCAIEIEIPPLAGLGTSAALAVALLRAKKTIGGAMTKREMLAAAMAVENTAHGNSSGLDPAISLSGGVIAFRRRGGDGDGGAVQIKIKRLRPAASFHIVAGVRGSHGGTGARVRAIADLRSRAPATVGAAIKTLGAAARAGITALVEGDLALGGQAADLAHGVLSGLGLVGGEVESFTRLAREQGALGAKMSGAGGEGGAFYAIAPDIRAAHAIRDLWQQRGAESWIETAT